MTEEEKREEYMDITVLAKAYMEYFKKNYLSRYESKSDFYSGYTVVFFSTEYNSVEFKATQITTYTLNKMGKKNLFDEYVTVLGYNYDGFAIYDKDCNEVTEDWENAECF